jgi:disulfide bond formation protein DsbB
MAKGKAPCEVCRLIRGYLLVFVPLLIMLVLFRLDGNAEPLVTFDLADAVAGGIGLVLVGQIAWKAYHEFGPGRRR